MVNSLNYHDFVGIMEMRSILTRGGRLAMKTTVAAIIFRLDHLLLGFLAELDRAAVDDGRVAGAGVEEAGANAMWIALFIGDGVQGFHADLAGAVTDAQPAGWGTCQPARRY